MREFTVKQNDANQRLDKFLQKAVPKLPKGLLYKYLRLKRIKVNGKKSEISYRLCEGDRLELYLNDEFFEGERDFENKKADFLSAGTEIPLVYEDENIILADKKAGLCVHEDNDNEKDTLINRCLRYLYEKGEYAPESELSFTPALCNRIDRNTSGIVIIAKNAEALRILNEKIKNREVRKFYLCVVSGIVEPKQATLKHFLLRNENESLVKILEKPTSESKTVITRYKTLKASGKNTLLEVELGTGRTHQIRAHMAYINHPIIGDGKYGLNRINHEYGQKQQLLCAYRLRFEFEKSESPHLLSYLNSREFQVDEVWFEKEFSAKF